MATKKELEMALDMALDMRFSDDCPLDNLDVMGYCGVNGDKCKSNGKKCWKAHFIKQARAKGKNK